MCNVHLAKPDGVYTIPRRGVVCTLAFVAQHDGIHTTGVSRTVRIRLNVVRSVRVAKPCVVGVVCNVHLAKPDCVYTIQRRGVVRTVHVAKTR